MLSNFAAYLAQSTRPVTVRVYVSAVRNWHIELGYEDPCAEAVLLKRVLRGICRFHGTDVVATRLPITLPILLKLSTACMNTPLLTGTDRLMFRCAMLIAFFGFLRCSEITGAHIRRHCLQVNADHINLHLSSSKTDPQGKGVDIIVGPGRSPLCAVAAAKEYLEATASQAPESPLFVYTNGQSLTRQAFTATVRCLLASSGHDLCHQYSSHSFRIGAATTAAAAGVPESMIRCAGRWQSDACLRYIRTPVASKCRLAWKMCSQLSLV